MGKGSEWLAGWMEKLTENGIGFSLVFGRIDPNKWSFARQDVFKCTLFMAGCCVDILYRLP